MGNGDKIYISTTRFIYPLQFFNLWYTMVYYYGENQIMLTKLLNYKRESYARYDTVDQLHILNYIVQNIKSFKI